MNNDIALGTNIFCCYRVLLDFTTTRVVRVIVVVVVIVVVIVVVVVVVVVIVVVVVVVVIVVIVVVVVVIVVAVVVVVSVIIVVFFFVVVIVDIIVVMAVVVVVVVIKVGMICASVGDVTVLSPVPDSQRWCCHRQLLLVSRINKQNNHTWRTLQKHSVQRPYREVSAALLEKR